MSPHFAALVLALAVPEPGQIVEGVACRTRPEWTYALFAPEGYTREQTWPILYVFDTEGRGAQAARRFQEAAAARGYLVASSDHTQTDNLEAPNAQVIDALWRDTHERLSIDERRVYFAGFSGTARVAANLALYLPGKVAGVLASGAGYPPGEAPRRNRDFAFFGTVGVRDFNYPEVRDLGDELARLALPHRIEEFDGDHEWIPRELTGLALEWLDLDAMRRGSLARDEARMIAHRARGLALAADLEARGLRVGAYREALATERDLRGLVDVAPLAALAERLRRAGATRELEAERRLEKQDRDAYQQIDRVFQRLLEERELPSLASLRARTKVDDLQRGAAGSGARGASAQRRLAHLYARAAFYVPRDLREDRDLGRAALCYQLAGELRPERPGPWFGLARTRARAGAPAEALAALRRAVENGLRDRARIAGEPDLASLAGEPGFQALLASLPASE